MSSPHIVLLDNHDSFVYNLVDALAGFDTTVFRNTVAVDEVLAARPDIIVLSPGPGHPRSAGRRAQLPHRGIQEALGSRGTRRGWVWCQGWRR